MRPVSTYVVALMASAQASAPSLFSGTGADGVAPQPLSITFTNPDNLIDLSIRVPAIWTWDVVDQSEFDMVTIKQMALYKVDSSNTSAIIWPTPQNPDNTNIASTQWLAVHNIVTEINRLSGEVSMNAEASPTLRAFLQQNQFTSMDGLYIELSWQGTNQANPNAARTGNSYGPVFALYDSTDPNAGRASAASRLSSITAKFNSPPVLVASLTTPTSSVNGPADLTALATNSPLTPGSGGSNGPNSSQPSSGPTASSTAIPVAATNSSDPSSTVIPFPFSRSSSSLSAGAIVGIALGAVIIFAIALALGYILIRRSSRRRRTSLAANSSPSPVQGVFHLASRGRDEMMMDKEVNTRTVDSPSSPSPYSDEAFLAPAMAGAVGPTAGGAPPAMSHNVYTTAEGPSIPGHPTTSAVPTPGRSVPSGLPSSVAALVEDGMTEDEIRRLAEEEHVLDQAIADAGPH